MCNQFIVGLLYSLDTKLWRLVYMFAFFKEYSSYMQVINYCKVIVLNVIFRNYFYITPTPFFFLFASFILSHYFTSLFNLYLCNIHLHSLSLIFKHTHKHTHCPSCWCVFTHSQFQLRFFCSFLSPSMFFFQPQCSLSLFLSL